MKTRVLVVDDSALARDMVCTALSRADDIEVVGMAADPLLARRQIALLHPDVLTLDVEMPRMDGLSFLDQVMRLRPMPVVMVSTLTSQGSGVSLKALAMGAVDVVAKPVASGVAFETLSEDLVAKVRLAGVARVHVSQRTTRPQPLMSPCPGRLIAAVGGMGAVQAMADLLHAWPADAPPLLLMPAVGTFDPVDLAAVFDRGTTSRVVAAQPNLPLRDGQVVVFAPAQGLTICAQPNGGYAVAPLENGGAFCPNPVDRLLMDLAAVAGASAIAVTLTGSQLDGAAGVGAVTQAGGVSLVQDRASSMFHMLADDVIRHGGKHRIVALPRLAREILSVCQTGPE